LRLARNSTELQQEDFVKSSAIKKMIQSGIVGKLETTFRLLKLNMIECKQVDLRKLDIIKKIIRNSTFDKITDAFTK